MGKRLGGGGPGGGIGGGTKAGPRHCMLGYMPGGGMGGMRRGAMAMGG
jgi:hypothetical protein